MWISSFLGIDGVEERIAITGSGENAVCVRADWAVTAETAYRQTSTASRIVFALVMAMQADVRRRSSGVLMIAPRLPFPDDR